MASDPIDQFMAEHRWAISVLDDMRRWAEEMDAERACRSGVNPYQTAGVVRRVREFDSELEAHFRKEEEALFPLLEKHIPRNGGPVGVMLDEHVRLRDLRRRLVSAAPGAEAGTTIEGFEAVATELDDLLRNHIAKEDGILFPLGREVLTSAEMAEVARRMESIAVAR